MPARRPFREYTCPDDSEVSLRRYLARLIDPERVHPPHEAHAVAVVDRDSLTAAKANEHLRSLPPVGELHVIEVPELNGPEGRTVRGRRLSHLRAAGCAGAAVARRRQLHARFRRTGELSPTSTR